MCGIFGVIAHPNSEISAQETNKIAHKLFLLSESRGKESSGIAVKNTTKHKIELLKYSLKASDFVKTNDYQRFLKSSFDGIFKDGNIEQSFALIAHARLVTNGSEENNNNNQPVVKNGIVAVHNGIVTNVHELWKEYPSLHREYEVDTEILLALVRHFIDGGLSMIAAVQKAYQIIKGTASVALLFNTSNKVILASNNASLYYAYNREKGLLIFASENYMLQTAIDDLKLHDRFSIGESQWISSFSAMELDLSTFDLTHFSIKSGVELDATKNGINTQEDSIINHSPDKPVDLTIAEKNLILLKDSPLRNLLKFDLEAVNKLKRCSACLLPETFPFIAYNPQGVCNYCEKYVVKKQGAREAEFKELVKQYKGKDNKPNCVVPFSGGRDSSYGLHYIYHELGLRPITYTYDWGMVTDLARRNIARICGKLGVENIIVSADIHMKRNNIRKNVEAWLKKPDLGMIPLFMAGDKQFFYYSNLIKRQNNIKIDIWSTNILENTDFKVGFCGISPSFDKTRPDHLPLSSKLKLLGYYGKNFLTNPGYLNSSLVDTMVSFYSYYAEPRTHFYQLFDWIKWDENKIEKTLFDEYEWEISPDTTTTWRMVMELPLFTIMFILP